MLFLGLFHAGSISSARDRIVCSSKRVQCACILTKTKPKSKYVRRMWAANNSATDVIIILWDLAFPASMVSSNIHVIEMVNPTTDYSNQNILTPTSNYVILFGIFKQKITYVKGEYYKTYQCIALNVCHNHPECSKKPT